MIIMRIILIVIITVITTDRMVHDDEITTITKDYGDGDDNSKINNINNPQQ